MKNAAEQFIKLNSILNAPGNPVQESWINARHIVQFGPSAEEYAKIGASSVVTMFTGMCFYCTDHPTDIEAALRKIESIE